MLNIEFYLEHVYFDTFIRNFKKSYEFKTFKNKKK